MINLVDAGAMRWRMVVAAMGHDVTYHVNDGPGVTLRCFMYGVKVQRLFGEAMQGDLVATLNADEFIAKIGPLPKKFDRVRSATRTWTVEAHRGAPEGTDPPVVFKLLLRGGTQ